MKEKGFPRSREESNFRPSVALEGRANSCMVKATDTALSSTTSGWVAGQCPSIMDLKSAINASPALPLLFRGSHFQAISLLWKGLAGAGLTSLHLLKRQGHVCHLPLMQTQLPGPPHPWWHGKAMGCSAIKV